MDEHLFDYDEDPRAPESGEEAFAPDGEYDAIPQGDDED